jgi:hypothetical protein
MRPALLCLALLAAGLGGCKKETTCPTDQRLCDGTCVAVSTDRAHCGSCGHACGDGFTCSAGECECPAPRSACGDACVDLHSDPQHCGDCAVACDPDQVCSTADGGTPACTLSCSAAQPTACGAACVNLQTDSAHCGACGHTCETGERCATGRCIADLFLGCFNTGDVREATSDLAPAGKPIPVSVGPIGLAWIEGRLFAASSGYGYPEVVSRISLDPPGARAEPIWSTNLTSDLEFLAARGGNLFVSHVSAMSALVLSPGGAVVDELFFAGSQDPNPNPLGMAFTEHAAYVALQKTDQVAVLDLSALDAGPCTAGHCLSETTRVDVSGLATGGARAMPSAILVHGGRAFVTLWNLDGSWQPPAGSHGRLAVIDTATNTLDATVDAGGTAGALDLGAECLNPAGLAVHGTTLYVTCGGWGASGIVGGAIVPVDLSGATPAVKPALAVPADAAPGSLAFCGTAGYVGDRNSGRVFRLDPVQNTVDRTETLCPASQSGYAYVASVLCGE